MKTFPLHLDEDLHRSIKHAAIDEGITMREWILRAAYERLSNEGREDDAIPRRHSNNAE
jgi:hypothetical protein